MDLVRRRCHRIGYSLGLAYPPTWLEAMFLHETDSHRIAPNMSFTIEPNLTLPDEGFGLKMGDTVLCTEDGGESLSALGHGLVVVD
jgi:Xaa-Pro dipeptidase